MRLLVLGGPYSGKTTAHRSGKGVDLEELPQWDEQNRETYIDMVKELIDSDEDVVLAHFSKTLYDYGIRKRLVRIVVLPPAELERRADEANDVSRSNAALHQLATLTDWLATKNNRVKLFTSIDSAIKGGN